jgi:hypothetical protein
VNRERDELIDLAELADALRDREGPPRPQGGETRRFRPRRLLVAAVLAAAIGAAVAVAIATRGGDQASSSRKQTPSRPGGSASASCAAAVEWHGTSYIGSKVRGPVKLASSLGEGTLPACNDMGGAGGGTPRDSVAVVAVDGVSSDEAVALAGDSSVVYVNPDSFPQLPHTALHDLIYGPSPDLPNERSECEPGHTSTADVRAVVRAASFGVLAVTILEPEGLPRQNWIFPDAQTVITGGGATPHVAAGDGVRAQVLVCRHADDPHFLKLVATRLSLAPRPPR